MVIYRSDLPSRRLVATYPSPPQPPQSGQGSPSQISATTAISNTISNPTLDSRMGAQNAAVAPKPFFELHKVLQQRLDKTKCLSKLVEQAQATRLDNEHNGNESEGKATAKEDVVIDGAPETELDAGGESDQIELQDGDGVEIEGSDVDGEGTGVDASTGRWTDAYAGVAGDEKARTDFEALTDPSASDGDRETAVGNPSTDSEVSSGEEVSTAPFLRSSTRTRSPSHTDRASPARSSNSSICSVRLYPSDTSSRITDAVATVISKDVSAVVDKSEAEDTIPRPSRSRSPRVVINNSGPDRLRRLKEDWTFFPHLPGADDSSEPDHQDEQAEATTHYSTQPGSRPPRVVVNNSHSDRLRRLTEDWIIFRTLPGADDDSDLNAQRRQTRSATRKRLASQRRRENC